ncbi:aminomethyl-transferring glycine dehydrogenase subunit GcvPA [Candidatus Bathyarchaeota archaeon]|nr:MAG: aminomethyl-transferring glycine dehydrogenase subunit GcvPA [Candidatus Bathyarchaeota archaeon]
MFNRYIPNATEENRKKLEKTIGIENVKALFSDIPQEIRLKKPLRIPGPLSELDVRRKTEEILKKNHSIKELTSFLGGGIWPHHVPAVVDEVSSRSEFLTSYTPYQPEISQGILQALFEYQSMICELLDMDVANCSMYDWATSLGEAARMAARVTQRSKFIIPHFISPERLGVLKVYAEPAGIEVIEVNQDLQTGQIDLEDLKEKVSKDAAGVYIENPSYLGFLIDSPEAIAEIVHDAGGLFIVGVDPTSLGVLRPPGNYEADIAIGEGQPLGNYMNGGGPLLGIFACKDEKSLVRQMPGRIVGMTTTRDGKDRAFCLVLQTREQHIRRHKATSNICTNEALCALRAAVYMSLLGRKGFRELGEIILSRTYYAIKMLSEIEDVRVPFFETYHFKEFTVNFDGTSKSLQEIKRELLKHGIVGGKPLIREFPELGQTTLLCVTEMHTLQDIERLHRSLKDILEA